MEASEQREAATPEPLTEEETARRQSLEDEHERLLLMVMGLEQEWLLDDRIAYALKHAA
jgi:hypothetical protein